VLSDTTLTSSTSDYFERDGKPHASRRNPVFVALGPRYQAQNGTDKTPRWKIQGFPSVPASTCRARCPTSRWRVPEGNKFTISFSGYSGRRLMKRLFRQRRRITRFASRCMRHSRKPVHSLVEATVPREERLVPSC
jgi:hypothetical protein